MIAITSISVGRHWQRTGRNNGSNIRLLFFSSALQPTADEINQRNSTKGNKTQALAQFVAEQTALAQASPQKFPGRF
jgi:hypothetical protein